MPLNRRCAHCGSMDTRWVIDELQCLECGKLTDLNGVAIPTLVQYGPDWEEQNGQGSNGS